MSSFITEEDLYIGLEEFADKPGRRVEKVTLSADAAAEVTTGFNKALIFDALFGGGVDPICGLYWHTGMQQYRVGVQYPPTEGNTRPVPAEFNALIQKWEASK